MCAHTHPHTCTHVRTYRHTRTGIHRTHAHRRTHTGTHTPTHMCTHVHTHRHTQDTRRRTHTGTHRNMHACTCTQMQYTQEHTYTDAHTHAHTRRHIRTHPPTRALRIKTPVVPVAPGCGRVPVTHSVWSRGGRRGPAMSPRTGSPAAPGPWPPTALHERLLRAGPGFLDRLARVQSHVVLGVGGPARGTRRARAARSWVQRSGGRPVPQPPWPASLPQRAVPSFSLRDTRQQGVGQLVSSLLKEKLNL